MPILASEVLKRTAIILNDEQYVRWPVEELLDWLNDAAAETVIRRPAARGVTGTITLVEGILQSIPDGGIELMDIPRNVAGRAIRRTDRQLLDDINPDWPNMKLATAIKHYTFDERTPTTFYCYPPAQAGAQVQALYSAAPPLVTAPEDELDLSRAYIGPLVSYILYRALAKDSEYGNGAVAAAHYQAFSEALGTRNEVSGAVSPNAGSV
jgi:hypothetical protein